MILKVFSTKREIREYIKTHNNTFLPKLITIGEFLDKCIVVKGASLIDTDLKKIYLYKALEKVEIEKLGFRKDFLNFFKNSEFVLSFFNEIFLEKRNIEEIELADTYLEYSDHLEVLKNLYYEYKNLLEKDGLYDKTTIKEYEINRKFFEDIQKVEIHLSGYLPKFDLEIIKQLPCSVEVNFRVTPYNKVLIRKMFGDFKEGEYKYDLHKNSVLEFTPLKKLGTIEVEHFSSRINEANFVFASIEEMIQSGIKPENIAIILPDEGFSEYLKILDIHNNLNFAMGESFIKSNIFIMLEAIYKYITEKDPVSLKKAKNKIEEFEKLKSFNDVLEFVLKNSSMRERKILDEEIYKISKLEELKNFSKDEILHFLLERFKNLTFDDVKGGKVTAMGVLESRGMKYEGVVIVDFNDDYVPNVSDKDYFLNSAIRKKANLPTRKDKEALQKNYYYNILLNAKKVKIAYVKNEEKEPSRFLYELGLDFGENKDEYYSEAVYKVSKPEFYEYEETFEKPEILTPTKLKTLLECPMKYYFSYVLNIKNEDEKEYFGSRFHNVLQEVLKQKPSSPKEYFEMIMENLLQNTSKKEYFEIKSGWEEKIKKFAYRDYEELTDKIYTEINLPSKNFKNFILQARADRIIGNKIYDYKTSSNQDYLKDLTQAEFYKYLMPESEIYFWDINKAELIPVNPDPKKLEEKIQSIEYKTKRSENRDKCKFCEYRFACLHFES
ncbi:PD-(D/E)XK nuclease family protein [Nautilia lithotrophica]